ncbi:MAG: hypothetical protein QXZ51_02995 [Candidatus Bathyarchaeia archaeon]
MAKSRLSSLESLDNQHTSPGLVEMVNAISLDIYYIIGGCLTFKVGIHIKAGIAAFKK